MTLAIRLYKYLQVIEPHSGHLHIPRSSEHKEHLQQMAAKFWKEINEMLTKIPRPLLLLLKTNGEGHGVGIKHFTGPS
jgi:hypothetical protein